MNTDELKFWLDWYVGLDAALERGVGSLACYRDPEGGVRHAVDEAALPVLQEIRALFLEAGRVNVFVPRDPVGAQVWPANWRETERAEALLQLVEAPAYLAQDQGFRVEEPEAPTGLLRLIELLEAQAYCREVSAGAVERCPAWTRVVPELFADGLEKIVTEALPAFDLLPRAGVKRVLADLTLPAEVMSPFLPFVEKDLSLRRLVEEHELLPPQEAAEKEETPA